MGGSARVRSICDLRFAAKRVIEASRVAMKGYDGREAEMLGSDH
jgi:hypothetical protein